MQLDTHTSLLTDRHAGSQRKRRIDGETGSHTACRQAEKEIDIQTAAICADRQIDLQVDRQIDRQIDRKIFRQMERKRDKCTNEIYIQIDE